MTAVAPRSLARARARRATLPAAMHALERSLATAVREPVWSDRLTARVEQLDRAFRDHVTTTEGPDGTYAAVLAEDPRLAHAVERLLGEHRAIRAGIDRLAALTGARIAALAGAVRVAAHPAGGGHHDGLDAITLHEEGRSLLDLLARHRRHGADLVHEAYEHEIGGYG